MSSGDLMYSMMTTAYLKFAGRVDLQCFHHIRIQRDDD